MIATLRGTVNRLRFTSLTFIVLMSGCASNGNAAPAEKERTGLDRLFRLPIDEGHAGVNEAIQIVHALYGVPAEIELSLLTNSAEPVALTDGTVISRATASTSGSSISMAVAEKPCFSVERAVALTGARKMLDGPHGDAGYDAYSFKNQESSIYFSTAGSGRACVGSISISKIFPQKAS